MSHGDEMESQSQVSLREYLDASISGLRREMRAEQAAAKEAILKAESATEKRFEAMNEFRAQLSDQSATFVTRDVLAGVDTKLTATGVHNRELIGGLTARLDTRDGQDTGSRLTMSSVVTMVTVAVAVLGLLIVMSNALTNH